MLIAIAWVVAIVGDRAHSQRSSDLGTAGFWASNDFIGLVALAIIPVLGFFAIATLIRRAQDLRNAATAVTQAAIRLAEPETTASEKVASVGQAVRREVNALGDGLERALSRAGELEVMIHNEVTALERTYSDNESRMRALIQELASQREAVITNTERVREAITESHTGLVFDLDMISQRIAGTIVESGGNLTKALETAGNSLNGAFGERTESFVSLIDQRTSHLLSALDDSASRLNITLEDRSNSISQAFENRTMDLSSAPSMPARRRADRSARPALDHPLGSHREPHLLAGQAPQPGRYHPARPAARSRPRSVLGSRHDRHAHLDRYPAAHS